jgi:hypothetical protein
MTVKPWTSFNVSTLLAWLDFCLQNGIDFESTILQRLKEATEQHPGHVVGFTIQQVKNKLISLGRGRKDAESALDMRYPGLREIISKGSVCIPGLARELRLEIAGAIERFRISYARSQPTIHPAQPLGGQDSPKERSSTQSDRHDGHIRQNLDMHGTPRACPNVVSLSSKPQNEVVQRTLLIFRPDTCQSCSRPPEFKNLRRPDAHPQWALSFRRFHESCNSLALAKDDSYSRATKGWKSLAALPTSRCR